jgi:hypothetical protein
MGNVHTTGSADGSYILVNSTMAVTALVSLPLLLPPHWLFSFLCAVISFSTNVENQKEATKTTREIPLFGYRVATPGRRQHRNVSPSCSTMNQAVCLYSRKRV